MPAGVKTAMATRRPLRAAVIAMALIAVLPACGASDSATTVGSSASATTVGSSATEGGDGTFPADSFAIIANADVGVGRSRLLVGVLEEGGRRLGSPADEVTISIRPTDRPDSIQTEKGIFTWIVEGALGLYRAEFDLDSPGIWEAVVVPRVGDPLPPAGFQVLADPAAPAVGEQAPAPQTPTLGDSSLEEITTDPDPDLSFYELSLHEAIGNARKTVVVFSTPAFCQTAACGPLLDITKEVAPKHPDVDFIHIEVYTNLTDPDFAPTPEYLAPSVLSQWWNLPSEPWVFVVDEAGIIQARFEGVIAAEELDDEL
jgi:hypothetical protein